MKKLFLTSSFAQSADKLSELIPNPKGLNLAFIPTARDPYPTSPWADIDWHKLLELGFNAEMYDIKDKTEAQIYNDLKNKDVIFVCGGNTFYLLDHARKSGFDKAVVRLVNEGKIYIGSSAGSYLACPTIEAATWKNQDKNIVGMSDFTALNLVPFILFVHYKLEHEDLLKQEIPKAKYPVRILKDDQAILVQEDDYKLVGESKH